MWPYVDSVYSKSQSESIQRNGTIRVQRYDCRFWKFTKSSTAREESEGQTIKRRHSSIRDKDLCHVQIKISQPVETGTLWKTLYTSAAYNCVVQTPHADTV